MPSNKDSNNKNKKSKINVGKIKNKGPKYRRQESSDDDLDSEDEIFDSDDYKDLLAELFPSKYSKKRAKASGLKKRLNGKGKVPINSKKKKRKEESEEESEEYFRSN